MEEGAYFLSFAIFFLFLLLEPTPQKCPSAQSDNLLQYFLLFVHIHLNLDLYISTKRFDVLNDLSSPTTTRPTLNKTSYCTYISNRPLQKPHLSKSEQHELQHRDLGFEGSREKSGPTWIALRDVVLGHFLG